MKTLELAEATAPLADYARLANTEPVIVTLNGQPIAALIGITDADWETLALSTDTDFLALIERSRARQQAESGVPAAEMRKRLEREP